MKLLDNIKGFSFIFGKMAKLSPYKKKIAAAKQAGDFDEERKLIRDAVWEWSDSIFKYIDADINVVNPENLPESGPVVYVANHQSYGDMPLLFYVVKNHQIGFVAKDSLKGSPFFGAWINASRGLYINRGDARASLQTINDGAELLKQGFSLVIFPEGTRSHCAEMGEFKAGSLKLATKAKVPIVPVTISGTYHFFEETGAITWGVHVDVIIHEPIDTANLSRAELAELPEKVEGTIRNGLESLK
ncbi:MAG: 1-acyl-sn-glycerol-3-phosphate acyltransferase [Firmicutes bacterium]|nr:1-acyl-sn-glycerol-3-phosphate acyltransferase [Bacillota bacterium]MBQ1959511.1 1-acyl-sn-glycerol-3-phosphate acyltransferase [Bacillota bacterium]